MNKLVFSRSIKSVIITYRLYIYILAVDIFVEHVGG